MTFLNIDRCRCQNVYCILVLHAVIRGMMQLAARQLNTSSMWDGANGCHKVHNAQPFFLQHMLLPANGLSAMCMSSTYLASTECLVCCKSKHDCCEHDLTRQHNTAVCAKHFQALMAQDGPRLQQQYIDDLDSSARMEITRPSLSGS